MQLIIFDIDGTIINSVKADDSCFMETFKTLFKVDLFNEKWHNYKNITDTGLTMEIFENHFNRLPKESEIVAVKQHFYGLLKSRMNEVEEIKGAINFIRELDAMNDYNIAFATGGWKKTALLKCNSIDFDLKEFVFKSSDDHFERTKIIELSIGTSKLLNSIGRYKTITYIGDGSWDYKATQALGINFIGIDANSNNRLKNLGVNKIIKDYSDIDSVLECI